MGTTTGKPTIPSKPAQQGIRQTNPSNTVHKSQINITIEVLTVNLFFDGTKNNKYNIDNKTRYSRQTTKDPKGYESYTNAYSNVAHLYEAAYQQTNKNNTIINIYVEGMGTTKDRVDDQQGFAMGSGITGITGRANHAFETMRLAIQEKRSRFRIARIRLNAFGFSRGAATARHFLSNFKGHRDLGGWGISIPFRINFVGLFDTVSSFDPRSVSEAGWDITKKAGLNVAKKVPTPTPWMFIPSASNENHFPEFNNDVVELNLTLDTNKNTHPLKVFQICAEDEYRTFFSLTDIKSAKLGRGKVDNRFTGFGYEIYLPGAHSDIGGGYPNGINEEYRCSFYEHKLAEWLLKQGFYTQGQTETELPRDDDMGYTHFHRTNIPFDAYMIALKVMYAMAIKQGGMNGIFSDKYIQDKCDSDYDVINELVAKIPTQVLKEVEQTGWHANLGIFDFSRHYGDLKTFRNQFIHWSAKKEFGYEVRRGKTTEKDALGDAQQVAADTGVAMGALAGADNLLSLEPHRVVHDG